MWHNDHFVITDYIIRLVLIIISLLLLYYSNNLFYLVRNKRTAQHESLQPPDMHICVWFMKRNISIGSLSQGNAHIDLYNMKSD